MLMLFAAHSWGWNEGDKTKSEVGASWKWGEHGCNYVGSASTGGEVS